MSLTDSWTPEELARFEKKEEARRQKNRDSCQSYQGRKRRAVIEKLGGKCVRCGEDDPAALQIDEHDKKLSWSQRYRAILDGKKFRLLCATCNWKKRAALKEATGRPRPSY
jgi:hypothetical protein